MVTATSPAAAVWCQRQIGCMRWEERFRPELTIVRAKFIAKAEGRLTDAPGGVKLGCMIAQLTPRLPKFPEGEAVWISRCASGIGFNPLCRPLQPVREVFCHGSLRVRGRQFGA